MTTDAGRGAEMVRRAREFVEKSELFVGAPSLLKTGATLRPLADWQEALVVRALASFGESLVEEACKVVCEWCREGSQADFYSAVSGWKHAIGSGNLICMASNIRAYFGRQR